MSSQTIYFPAQWSFQGKFAKNSLSQLKSPALEVDATIESIENGHRCLWVDSEGQKNETLILSKKPAQVDENGPPILITPDGDPLTCEEDWESGRSKIRWHFPIPAIIGPTDFDAIAGVAKRVLASWEGRFSFAEEKVSTAGQTEVPGLRPAQVGALHAILAHWTVEESPATVVMPTGTGKTETMLSLLICKRPQRVLVVVPSVALREQLTAKFLTLGVLKGKNGWGGIIDRSAEYPVVGKLEHGFKGIEDAEPFFSNANVIIANIDALTACTSAVRSQIAQWCSHLYIDETHHSAAVTWAEVRRQFKARNKPIVGFTATPYRNDQKLVEGAIIYSYPLTKVQDEGHFTSINFKPVRWFHKATADEAIAAAAVKQLKEDRQKYSHLVMARTSDIERAKEVHEIYKRLAPEHNPELIHSKTPKDEQRAILRRLRSGQSHIVVCVAMFGEGFDLPELKIAAIHDTHKSLAITLQFTGRFTRGRKDLGQATLIANIAANRELKDALRALYAENPDWNTLLCDLSEEATGRQRARTRMIQGFDRVPSNLPVQNLNPKFSAEVFISKNDDWNPEALERILRPSQLLVPPIINHDAKIILFVTRLESEVKWADARELQDISHHLNLIHFDVGRKLLFINSSDTSQLHKEWAEKICGESVELIEGETVFRALAGLNRLMLLNAGLKDTLSQAVRFMMLVGADVREALKDGQMENRIKCNLFTRGFRDGQRSSVGCSAKGRVWAHAQAEDISGWLEWCEGIGDRLLDNSIDMQQVLKNALIPEIIEERPDAVPIAYEWSDSTLGRGEESLYLGYKGVQIPFFEAELQVVNPSRTGNLTFQFCMETASLDEDEDEEEAESVVLQARYEIRFDGKNFNYHPLDEEPTLYVGRKKTEFKLSQWLNREPVVVRFHDGSWLEGNVFCKPRKERTPFDPKRIEDWDWKGTDITKESQYKTKDKKRLHRKDSIQYRVIQELCAKDYDVVFDDDSAGESADVVALKILGDRLQIHLFHCKFAKKLEPGERISELYEVCGQAQKSIHWRRDIEGLLEHLSHRNESWRKKYKISRFQKGDAEKLGEITVASRELRADVEIAIVQPGISQKNATQEQLDLLATTEIYLSEVAAVPLRVIGSKDIVV